MALYLIFVSPDSNVFMANTNDSCENNSQFVQKEKNSIISIQIS